MNESTAEHNGSRDGLTDPGAWVARHGDVMFAYALRSVGHRALAEDLVQEALLAAFRGRDSFAGASAERTWLIGILKNKIIDHYRRAGREAPLDDAERVTDGDDGEYITAGPDGGQWRPDRRPAAWSVDPDDPVEQRQFREHLARCMEGLDRRVATAYRMREIEEVESSEICNILSVKPTNLRVMLHRARKLLRRCLELNWIGS